MKVNFYIKPFRDSKHWQGYRWGYRYVDENGKRKVITSADINELEKKVSAKGLPWAYSDEKIDQIIQQNNKIIELLEVIANK